MLPQADFDKIIEHISALAMTESTKITFSTAMIKNEEPKNLSPIEESKQRKNNQKKDSDQNQISPDLKRVIWDTNDYLRLLDGSFRGYSRLQLAESLNRSPAKVFSKIQKHVDMIDKVKATLSFIQRQSEKSNKNSKRLSTNSFEPI